MKHTQLIDELLKELSYRVGIVDIYNKEQQSIMSEILSEWGEYDIKETIFNFLNEVPKPNKNDDRYVSKGYGNYKLKGKEGEDDPTYKKDDSGNYVKVGGDETTDDEKPKKSLAQDVEYQKIVKKEKETRKKIEGEKEGTSTSNNKTDKTLGNQQQRDLDKMKSNSENWKDQLDEEKQKLLVDSFYHIEIVMSEDATDEEKKQSAEWLVENIGFATNENKSKAYLGKLGGLRKILSNMAGGGSAGTKRLVAEMEKHVELKETNFSGIKKQLTSAAKPDLGKENEFSPKKNPKVQSFFEGHPQLSKIRSGLWGLFGVAGEDGKIKMPSNQYPKEYLKQSFDNPALTRTIQKAQQFVDSGDLDPKYVQALKDHQERLARITEQYEIPSEEAARAIDDSYERMVVELHEADSDAAGSVLKQLAENRLYEVELARGEEVYLPSNGSFPGGDKIKVDTLERVSLVSCKWGKQGRIYGCPANAKAVTSLHPDESKRENQGQYLGEDGYTLLVKDELIKGNTTSETTEKTKKWIKDTLNEVGLGDVFSDDELTQISDITTEYLEFVESVKRELEGVTPAEKYWTLFNQKIAEKEKEIGDRLREVVSDEQIEKLIGKNNVGNLTTNNRILPQNLLGAIEISNNIRTSDGYGLEHNKQYFEKGKSKFVTDKGTSDPNDYSITFRDKRTAGRNGGGVQLSFSGDGGDKIDVNIGDNGEQTDSENNPIID